MTQKLAYEVLDEHGNQVYWYPVSNFKTVHLENMKKHILRRDPDAVVELPPEEESASAVKAPGKKSKKKQEG